IMDFGIAQVPHAQLTAAGEFFGTPSYMSPEQISARTVDGRSDLFSLGAVLYLMLTGNRAFDGESVPAILTHVASQHPPPPGRIVPGLPADVDYLIGRAMAKEPADRFPDGGIFSEDIEDVVAGRPPRHRGTWKSAVGGESTLSHGAMTTVPETLDMSLPETAPQRTEVATSPLGTDLISRRDLMAVGALAVLGLLAAVPLPLVAPRTPARAASAVPPRSPAAVRASPVPHGAS